MPKISKSKSRSIEFRLSYSFLRWGEITHLQRVWVGGGVKSSKVKDIAHFMAK